MHFHPTGWAAGPCELKTSPNPINERFYEKVINVKADVAALLNFFSDPHIDVRWSFPGLSRPRRRAAFILTLDSPASYFTIELGTKRNAVQLSFVP